MTNKESDNEKSHDNKIFPPENLENNEATNATYDEYRKPQVVLEDSDKSFYERNKLTLLIGTSVLIGSLAIFGAIKSCGDDQPKSKTSTEAESALAGQTFSELLAANLKKNSGRSVVLSNFNIARVLNDDLAAGNNSVETLSVSTTACTKSNGAITRPLKPSVSTIIFRNSESRNPFLPVILNEDHISTTEKYRTNFRRATKDSGYMHRDPTRMSKQNINFIKSAVDSQLCPAGSSAVNPQISSRRLLIDDAAFEGRQPYDTNNRNPLSGVGNFFERIGLGGVVSIILVVGIAALLSDGDFRSRFGRRKNY